MPELPDLTVYREHLERRILDTTLDDMRIAHPFLLRTVEPQIDELIGRRVVGVSLLGKRIVFALESEYYLVLHLMIAGRLKWADHPSPIPRKLGLARFDFSSGSMTLTEAGTRRRASLMLVHGSQALSKLDPGGIDPLASDQELFSRTLLRENHTIKRSLTDPRMFAGIGNAYSDEILHRAGLSPFKQSRNLSEEETKKLYRATRETLMAWIDRLSDESGEHFPKKVTAFHPKMAVHGKYDAPCPVCGTPIQRIQYAENECNYCPDCQTGGKLLADRGLSRLLKDDWPTTVEELEELKRG